ncbi:peptidase C26 [Oceanithermus profundus DSM 14977]|uniref:Peptidase C26 n=1 Tax=Oceanithermus profundus (strain DSM 14977 / NBRC 100410 / VKM B-2274 / 506) TaxID=670487 RepID=E4UA84_OCEP5|nr:gamma-glutamyl-gamma-aminobutyrate hydrolase family protein [Oceanithermus profundus]ADR37527.1 peptidase C26 [Oceanithermus profundus DSM 14977]
MPLIGVTSQTGRTGRVNVTPLWGVREPYRAALEAQGAGVVVLPPQPEPRLEGVLARLDGLLLPGGADLDPRHFGEDPHPRLGPVDPARDELELFAARWAAEHGLPTLGVCRGAQVGAVALGGSLYQDLESAGFTRIGHDQTAPAPALWHTVELEEDRWLAPLFGRRFRTNSYHHQAIRDPGPFRVLARAADGVIEAADLPDHPFFLLVQWHPELLPDHWGLFGLLVEAAAGRRASAAD